MVKTVIGEEHRLNSVEDRLSHSGLNCQVGLVIGKISTNLDKGFVFDLIPTPVNDAGDDATWIVESKDESKKRGGGGGKKV
nr:protein odr-4 homolog [Tanacetum cinerariifolium]